ncbi:LPS export ABC transporter periplasmic protein LptC [Rhizobium rosettiformans]|jgi:lipopolysaccharide export system protein LptC|uniref:LPS export ABC transporter periplasmic protein LptC n=2 Tax=Rhizobium rosettiformans TaxID=1368430 RepID=A0A4S8PYM3_9HYPH|nr:LPS export ABC transporter periplasmic protein LptC [Rhizobium rosettiformans]MBB5276200.1 lipopolysaccharide export system protein LptC [Rhizobium rosettiformans]MDR7028289.1 lipopolysaccharide export system protein LptC [Rhizobium rosettiformans]MDR7064429.1 lipopolysaccharide export system protein LptC [Rhizobium rosettiformans]THV36837.1 LPS export ABC transporter periplasmic protein LptC [Rhizobium rosettiformans W3]
MLQTTHDGLPTADSGSGAEAYRRAVNHSRRVRRLRFLLPVAALGITLAFVAVSFVRGLMPEELQIESAKIEDGKVVMEKPAIAGRNSDGVRYSMRAERALQDIKNPNMITLETIAAAVPVNDKVVANVVATSGIFDRGANILDLDKPFTLNLSSGIDAQFGSAHLDISGGTMKTDDPVAIQTKGASIVANSLEMKDKGRTMIFSGSVKLNIEPSALRSNRSMEAAQP